MSDILIITDSEMEPDYKICLKTKTNVMNRIDSVFLHIYHYFASSIVDLKPKLKDITFIGSDRALKNVNGFKVAHTFVTTH